MGRVETFYPTWRRIGQVATIIAILSFITLFLAIFAPSVALICKLEARKGPSSWNKRQQ